jgi:peptidoglycan/LPS O-acetylase OafA/YrhL
VRSASKGDFASVAGVDTLGQPLTGMVPRWRGYNLTDNAARGPIVPSAAHDPVHIPALDGLRGLAALIVFLSHFSNETGLLVGMFGRPTGELGVMLFFLLSGFLMGRLYLLQPFTAAHVHQFFVARISRVVPLYLAVVLASYFLSFLPDPIHDNVRGYRINNGNILDHIFFYDGESVLWTIPVEMKFYAVFPLLWLLFWRSSWSALAALVLLILAVFAIAHPLYPYDDPYRSLVYLGHFFLAGVLVATLNSYIVVLVLQLRDKWFLLEIMFLVAVCLLPIMSPHVFNSVFGLMPERWESEILFVYFVILLIFTLHSRLALIMLGGRIPRFLGDISYSMYLLHMLVIKFVAVHLGPIMRDFVGISLPVGMLFVVTLTICIVSSYLSFLLLERPARLWVGKRLGASFQVHKRPDTLRP